MTISFNILYMNKQINISFNISQSVPFFTSLLSTEWIFLMVNVASACSIIINYQRIDFCRMQLPTINHNLHLSRTRFIYSLRQVFFRNLRHNEVTVAAQSSCPTYTIELLGYDFSVLKNFWDLIFIYNH